MSAERAGAVSSERKRAVQRVERPNERGRAGPRNGNEIYRKRER